MDSIHRSVTEILDRKEIFCFEESLLTFVLLHFALK